MDMAEPIDLSAAYEDLSRSLNHINFILFVILLLKLTLNYAELCYNNNVRVMDLNELINVVTYQDLIDFLGPLVFICLVTLMLKIFKPNRHLVDKATSASQAVVTVPSIRSSPGLLDLPPELRVMIFRHLLVEPDGVDLDWGITPRRHSLGILRTNR